MSWAIFKSNILRIADNPGTINDISIVSNLYATEYDLAIKRGRDLINSVSLQQGNIAVMEQLFRVALLQGLNSNSSAFSLVNQMGNGVIAYWTGGIMNVFPIPVIPAPGSIQNVAVISNIVVSPGTWNPLPPLSPNNTTGLIVDLFISAATAHLSTVSGIVTTTSLYPSVPTPITAPGVVTWSGYFVPPAGPSMPAMASIEAVNQQISNANFDMDTQGVEVKTEELNGAENQINLAQNETEAATAKEYKQLATNEIQTKKYVSAPVAVEQTDIEEINENIAEDYKCEAGNRIVQAARRDIGILETGTQQNNGAGKNYGGRVGGGETPVGAAGRIDQMVGYTGLNNQANVARTGEGYYWCASAVTAWWKEAGLPTPNGSASCKSWASWAKSNGLYSNTPVVGSAILYGPVGSEHHIGIVESILPNGGVVTIEGNTGGGGFNRNGCGCFRKTPRLSNVSGYIHPPGCR